MLFYGYRDRCYCYDADCLPAGICASSSACFVVALISLKIFAGKKQGKQQQK